MNLAVYRDFSDINPIETGLKLLHWISESKSVVYTLHDIRKCYQKFSNDNYGVNMPI